MKLGRYNIELPYSAEKIEEFEIHEKVGEHTKVNIKIIAKEGEFEENINKSIEHEFVTIKEYKEDLKREIEIFNGIIANAYFSYKGKVQEIKIKSISTSIKLDMHPINKTYQNQNLTYKDIINSALKDYKKTDYIYQVKEEKKIDKFLLQYEETDWEFLQRLASHFNEILVMDSSINCIYNDKILSLKLRRTN